MNYSTRQAAKRLRISHATLARYVENGKVPTPQMVATGRTTTHIWTDEDIEHVRQLLPKIANGRKTRYQKKQLATSTQPSAKGKTEKELSVKPKSKTQTKKKTKAGPNHN
jgi:DNA-binding transcriptional MerR regulator